MPTPPDTSHTPTRRLIRHLAVGLGLTTLLTLFMVSWSLLVDIPDPIQTAAEPTESALARNTAPGWGNEALEALHAHVQGWSPIPIANACGLGASSCFKCHNGQRAAAPKMDKENGLWHAQHRTVNDSCAGCHAGNARIIKKELAHSGLVADPRAKPERCASCHKSDDTVALLKQYQKTK